MRVKSIVSQWIAFFAAEQTKENDQQTYLPIEQSEWKNVSSRLVEHDSLPRGVNVKAVEMNRQQTSKITDRSDHQ